MKCTFLSAGFAVITALSFAQPNRVTLGTEAGISVTDLAVTFKGYNGDTGYHSRMGYSGGVTLQYNFASDWGLLTGIMYERKGATTDITFTDQYGNITGQTTQKDNFNYLVVPLLVRSTFGKKANFFIDIGPYLGILLKRTWTFGNEIILSSGKILEEINQTDNTEHSEFGISGGIGIYAPLKNEKIILSFEVKDNKGLTDVAPSSYQTITTNSVLFLAGASYKFDSKKNNEEKK